MGGGEGELPRPSPCGGVCGELAGLHVGILCLGRLPRPVASSRGSESAMESVDTPGPLALLAPRPAPLTHRTRRLCAVARARRAAGARGPARRSTTAACPWHGTRCRCCTAPWPPRPEGGTEVGGPSADPAPEEPLALGPSPCCPRGKDPEGPKKGGPACDSRSLRTPRVTDSAAEVRPCLARAPPRLCRPGAGRGTQQGPAPLSYDLGRVILFPCLC